MSQWHALRAEVALTALAIPIESTRSEHCPKCKAPEKKLSITRTHNGCLFVCHRASCGFRGFVPMDGDGSSKDMPPAKPKARPYTGVAHIIDSVTMDKLFCGYEGLSPEATYDDITNWGVFRCDEGLLLACRGFNGELLGHVTRSLDKVIKTYRAREGADMYSYYRPPGSVFKPGALFIVEDCISAMCVASHGYNALALLGTYMSDYLRCALSDNQLQSRIMLDPDAAGKAVAMAKDLPGSKAVIGHTKDPKDLPDLDKLLWEFA